MQTLLDRVLVETTDSWFHVAGEPTYQTGYYNSGTFVDRSEQWMPSTKDVLVRFNFYISNV